VAVTELFAGIPVADFGAARPWYERLMGRPTDLVPHDTEVAWRLGEATGWVYVVADPDRAGRALVTVLVDDLDSHLGELAERGSRRVQSRSCPARPARPKSWTPTAT